MKLAYTAYDRTGAKVRDTIEAADAGAATETLRRQGLFVTQIKSDNGATGASPPASASSSRAPRQGGSPFGKAKRLKCTAMFARQLHVLVSTGTPLVEALVALERQAKEEKWRGVVADVRQRVEEGNSMAEALERHPEYFGPVTQSLVAAGESAGKLPTMLDRIGALTRKQLYVRSSVLGAMVYPSLLIVVAIAVLAILLMFVLPRFRKLFETLDMPLPATTKILMGVSDFLVAYWWTLPIALLAGGVAAVLWVRTEPGRRALDLLVIRIPKFGKIVQSFATARIVRLMGMLLSSYLPLLEVLQLVRETTSNVHYRELVGRAEDAVTRGEPISTAFNDPSMIDPAVYEALRSGESSGQVGPLMLNMADFLDEDNEVVVKSLTSIIEPVILLILGALVGLVALSMFLPLFDLTAMTSTKG